MLTFALLSVYLPDKKPGELLGELQARDTKDRITFIPDYPTDNSVLVTVHIGDFIFRKTHTEQRSAENAVIEEAIDFLRKFFQVVECFKAGMLGYTRFTTNLSIDRI